MIEFLAMQVRLGKITQDDFDRIRETLDPTEEPTDYTEESEGD